MSVVSDGRVAIWLIEAIKGTWGASADIVDVKDNELGGRSHVEHSEVLMYVLRDEEFHGML